MEQVALVREKHNRIAKVFYCAFFFIFLSSAPPLTASELSLSEIMATAKAKGLAINPTWQRLLYYQHSKFWGSRSFWDSPDFFLAPDGASNPENELEATLRSFFAPIPQDRVDDFHALCRFPARFAWLAKSLPLARATLPVVRCEAFKNFLSQTASKRISLVFSSYYIRSPGSMFGHTLLKLHRSADTTVLHNYQDMSISFSAGIPEDENLFNYGIKGLSGGYDGFFQLMPYYVKVQEYSNHEVRDLWEYELALSEDEITTLLYSLWEVGNAKADYYFFTENCAYVLLFLLEIASPSLNLLDKLHYWVIPIDTTRVINDAGLIRAIRYEPSSHSRYEERLSMVPEKNRPLVDKLLGVSSNDEIERLLINKDKSAKAAIIDTTLEFIEFSERLAVNKSAEKYKVPYAALLDYRARLAIKSPSLSRVPTNRPDKGHKTNMLQFATAKSSNRGGYIGLKWRPAIHDPLSSEEGYNKDMALTVLDHEVRYETQVQRLFIEKLEFVGVSYMPAFKLLKPQLSWESKVGIWQAGDISRDENFPVFEIFFGGGLTFSLPADDRIRLTFMPQLGIGMPLVNPYDGYVKSGGFARLLFTPIAKLRVLTDTQIYHHSNRAHSSKAGQLAIGFDIAPQTELRSYWRAESNRPNYVGLALVRFF